MEKYIHPTEESGKQFYIDFHQKGKIVMLNLLRFNETADYANHPELQSTVEITGKEAYELYIKHTLPLLEKAGSRVVFQGNAGNFVIGPESEKWDLALLVEHQSVASFMAFAQDQEYLKTAGHRTAALKDSRLLPMTQEI